MKSTEDLLSHVFDLQNDLETFTCYFIYNQQISDLINNIEMKRNYTRKAQLNMIARFMQFHLPSGSAVSSFKCVFISVPLHLPPI